MLLSKPLSPTPSRDRTSRPQEVAADVMERVVNVPGHQRSGCNGRYLGWRWWRVLSHGMLPITRRRPLAELWDDINVSEQQRMRHVNDDELGSEDSNFVRTDRFIAFWRTQLCLVHDNDFNLLHWTFHKRSTIDQCWLLRGDRACVSQSYFIKVDVFPAPN